MRLLEAVLGAQLSDVGFEPTPTYVDQITQVTVLSLESGALEHSANLTSSINSLLINYIFISGSKLEGHRNVKTLLFAK